MTKNIVRDKKNFASTDYHLSIAEIYYETRTIR